MKLALLVLITTISINSWAQLIDSSIYKKMPYTNLYAGSGALVMNINYTAVKKIRLALEKSTGSILKNRGEAHITVITPPEFQNSLGLILSSKEIHQLAKKRIQDAKFSVICIGEGKAQIGAKWEKTYFLVVESNDLINLRHEIYSEYLQKGGDAKLFDPDQYHPHITIGFTKKDLHPHQGVVKNVTSCRDDQ
ncbi:MAG: hypothetical protein HOE90_04845 [Bacteriovoracaceae bacterium]|jgi:2'-5' RNA ligase|nr:hypothetical protein [Bacteriovoracaceae bacterium]